MMFHEAAAIAREANVKALWLTHYSPSLEEPEQYIENARKIFENTTACRDGERTMICFED
jgi:ribonuclease Z